MPSTTRQALLQALSAAGGAYISGQQLAGQLGGSRAAALTAQGYALEAVSRRGYRLLGGDPFCAEAVGPYPAPVQVYDTLESSNRTAKLLALDGAPHGALVLTAHQSAGRGRLGRVFESPAGKGVYLSVLLRPAVPAASAQTATFGAAVAVCRAVQELCGLELGIKWVNDLYYQGKKVCGILTEAGTDLESGRLEWLVVGIGLNLTVPEDHLPTDKATSLQLVAHGLPDSMTLRDMIAAHLVDGLRSRLADFEADPHREATRAMEEMRPVCWTLDKPCEAHFVDGTTLRGTALELNPDASLTIRDDNGNLHTVHTADVGVLPQ